MNIDDFEGLLQDLIDDALAAGIDAYAIIGALDFQQVAIADGAQADKDEADDR